MNDHSTPTHVDSDATPDGVDASVQVPDALIDQWLLPLRRLAAKPLGEILRWDGTGYRLPEGFQFPIACRDPAVTLGARTFANMLICGYEMLVASFVTLPAHPDGKIHVDWDAARRVIASQCKGYLAETTQNAVVIDDMTAERNGLVYFAACVVSQKDERLLRDGRTLFWNAFAQMLAPGIEWLPCPGS